MIALENTLISEDLFTECFCCDLPTCKGICCVEGDAGAPLDPEEVAILEAILPKIKHLLSPAGLDEIHRHGVSTIAIDGSLVTPIVAGKECAFLIYDDQGMAVCAIEKAYEQGLIDFLKPISCHLYPIRVQALQDGEALNYDQWDICKDARLKGAALNMPVFRFLKAPLIRKYGTEWFQELDDVYRILHTKSQ